MTATNESNLGLYLGWTYGEDNWNTGMDANMSILGAISQLYVKSRTTTAKPVSPTNGDRYYVPVGATGDWSVYEKYITIYSAFHTGWLYVPAKAGMEFRVEDESNASLYYDGSALVASTSLSGYLTAASTYTATGDVTFQAPPKFSGSHTVDTTELATMGDVDTKIGAINYSTFVRTTGDQAVAGIKTFASSPVIPNASSSNEPVAKGQMDTAVAAVTGANVGTGADVFKAKSGNDIQMRTIVAGSNVVVTENADDITISAPVAAVDLTAGYSWTGEHTWDISGGKSFIVSDDPAIVDAMGFLGIIDHLVGFNADNIIVGYWHTNATTNNVVNYSVLNDDGSVALYSNIENGNGLASDVLLLTDTGVSSRTITVDTLIINATQQHSGYKSGTLASPPAGMVIGEVWADTTDSAVHPIYRISTVAT